MSAPAPYESGARRTYYGGPASAGSPEKTNERKKPGLALLLAFFFGGAGQLVAAAVVVFAILEIVAGYGLLQMKNWGRLLTIFFSAVTLFLILPVVMVSRGLPLVFASINAVVIFYLAMPSMRRLFRGEKSQRLSATA